MIKLNRSINEDDIPSFFYGAKKREIELHLLKERRSKLIDSKYKIKYKDWGVAKNNLKKESNEKCAYCESRFTEVAFGDVEHFRPKSKYWWLSYCYINYLVSCQLCNQSFKKDKFPIKGDVIAEPVAVTSLSTDSTLEGFAGTLSPDLFTSNQVSNFMKNLDKETPLLLNPYQETPSDYFGYELKDEEEEVHLVALNDNVREKVRASIEVFGLNRKELLKARWLFLLSYRMARQTKETVDEDHPSMIAAIFFLLRIKFKDFEYTGMINFYERQTSIKYLDKSLLSKIDPSRLL